MMNYNCPKCGNETETLNKGYCQDCCEANQNALDDHNAAFDYWEKLTDKEREDMIQKQKDA